MFLEFHFEKQFILFLIIYPILAFFEIILFKNEIISNNYLLYDSISLFFLIFIYGIEKYNSSHINMTERLKFFQEKKEKEKYKNVKICLHIICILILNLIVYIIFPIIDEPYKLNQSIILIFFFINEKLIFKNAIYSHHILSMIMFVIVNLSIILILLFNGKTNIGFFIYNIIYGYCSSLCLLLIKKINTNYDISVFLIGFLFGVIQLIFGIKDINNYIDIIKNNFLSCFLIVLNFFIYNYLYFYILKQYSPIHTKICEFFSVIVHLISKGNYKIQIILIIIFNIISSMIYLEIIELDFCELNKNIKKNITHRANIDSDFSRVLGSHSISLEDKSSEDD